MKNPYGINSTGDIAFVDDVERGIGIPIKKARVAASDDPGSSVYTW